MALRLRGSTSGYIELKAPASAGDNTLTLPTNNGSANQLLKTDGSGNLSWVDDNSGLTLSNDANNRIVTGTGSGLNAEANLTFDGSKLLVNTSTEGHTDADDLTIETSSGYCGITLRSPTNQGGVIYFSDGTSGAAEYDGQIVYSQNSQTMTLAAGGIGRLNVLNTGNISITNGDLVVASGHGIDFSATSDATGKDNELLDDYEEGTWVPTLHDSSGNNSSFATVTNANYTRIGDTVRLTVRAVNMLTAGMVGGNEVQLKGLPFDTNQYQYSACWIRSPNATNWGPNQNMVLAICDSNKVTFQASNGTNGVVFTWDDVVNNQTDLFMTLVYRAT